MALYLGNHIITPSIVLGGSGGGDIVTATNNTGVAITSGDKVWLQKSGNNWNIQPLGQFLYAQNVGSSVNIDWATLIANNFSTQGYIGLPFSPYTFNPGSYSWEIGTKIQTSSTATQSGNVEYIFGCLSSDKSIVFGYYQGVLQLYLGSNGQWNILQGADLGYYVSANTIYWFKVEFTGTAYNGYYSTDNINWTRFVHVESSYPILARKIYFGCAYDLPMKSGSFMDLSETYIKVNGSYSWKPVLTSLNKNMFSGIANESIASGATGEVKTILPN